MLSRFGMGSVSMFVAIPRLVYAYRLTSFAGCSFPCSFIISQVSSPSVALRGRAKGENPKSSYTSLMGNIDAKCLKMRHVVLAAEGNYKLLDGISRGYCCTDYSICIENSSPSLQTGIGQGFFVVFSNAC